MAANRPPRKPGAASDRNARAKPGDATPGRKPPTTPPPGRGSTRRPGSRGATPVRRSPGKSIVSKKQRPWGLIATSIVVVLFAIAVVVVAVRSQKSHNSASSTTSGPATPDPNNRWARPEIAAAKAITGLTYKPEPNHDHVTKTVTYDSSPPVGGNHSAIWPDCSGTVYPNAIANENAVHGLEHGAVWITYRPGLAKDQVDALTALVTGQNYTFMSPYPGLTSAVSLQAWGYQVFVNSASDPRVKQFLTTLRNKENVAPEYPGECSEPAFKQKPSTPGHPVLP